MVVPHEQRPGDVGRKHHQPRLGVHLLLEPQLGHTRTGLVEPVPRPAADRAVDRDLELIDGPADGRELELQVVGQRGPAHHQGMVVVDLADAAHLLPPVAVELQVDQRVVHPLPGRL